MRIKLILLIIFFLRITCFGQISRDSLFQSNYVPNELKYDTLDQVFLYENLIMAYIEPGDVIGKGNDFIKFNNNKPTYNEGVFMYFTSAFRYNKMKERNIDIYIDTTSIFKSISEMRYKAMQNRTLWEKTHINPFCGSYYKKYKMKIEVLYLGEVFQKIPLLMNCKEVAEYLKKNNGKNYQMCYVPTYLITRIFEWEEL